MSSFTYELHFSHKRKTIALQIKQDLLIVRAPSYLSERQVANFVNTKRDWISKKLNSSYNRTLKKTENAFNYCCGDRLFVFGKPFTLRIHLGDKANVTCIVDEMMITLTAQQFSSVDRKYDVKQLIQQWFSQQITLYVANKLPLFENHMRLYSTSTKVRIYKSRWGSCNSKKQLTFNALLAMVPTSVIDYVIIHELCHLQYMNHSNSFWQLVAIYCPSFVESKQWLKTHQKELYLPE